MVFHSFLDLVLKLPNLVFECFLETSLFFAFAEAGLVVKVKVLALLSSEITPNGSLTSITILLFNLSCLSRLANPSSSTPSISESSITDRVRAGADLRDPPVGRWVGIVTDGSMKLYWAQKIS